MTKNIRQMAMLEIISTKEIHTQGELAKEMITLKGEIVNTKNAWEIYRKELIAVGATQDDILQKGNFTSEIININNDNTFKPLSKASPKKLTNKRINKLTNLQLERFKKKEANKEANKEVTKIRLNVKPS